MDVCGLQPEDGCEAAVGGFRAGSGIPTLRNREGWGSRFDSRAAFPALLHIARRTIVLPDWEGPERDRRYGFDPLYPTCYKCPFCAGLSKLESYFSRQLFAACWLKSRIRRKHGRGQASSLLSVLQWKRVRNSETISGSTGRARDAGREAGSGRQCLNTFLIP